MLPDPLPPNSCKFCDRSFPSGDSMVAFIQHFPYHCMPYFHGAPYDIHIMSQMVWRPNLWGINNGRCQNNLPLWFNWPRSIYTWNENENYGTILLKKYLDLISRAMKFLVQIFTLLLFFKGIFKNKILIFWFFFLAKKEQFWVRFITFLFSPTINS